MTLTPQRDAYFEAVRALAIMGVVTLHASASVQPRIDFDAAPYTSLLCTAIIQISLCSVPVFVFLSGYFFQQAGRQGAEISIWQRLVRIIVPFLVWSLFWFILKNRGLYPLDFFSQVTTGSVLGPYYYVVALCIIIISAHVLLRMTSLNVVVWLFFAVQLVHICVCYALHMFKPQLGWWYFMFPASAWTGYFAAGLLLRERPQIADSVPAPAILVIIGVLASVIEAVFLYRHLGRAGGAFDPVKFSSFFYALAVIIAILRYKRAYTGILSVIGGMSFGIYLIHEPVRFRIAEALLRYDWVANVPVALLLAVVLGTLSVTAAVVALVRLAMGGRRARQLLGF